MLVHLLAISSRIAVIASVSMSSVSAGAQDHRAGGKAEQGRERRGRDELHERVVTPVRAERPRGVGAQAEERAMAERDDAGVAEDEVERQREQDEDQNPRAEREVAGHEKEASAASHGSHSVQRILGSAPGSEPISDRALTPNKLPPAVSTREFLWWPRKPGTHQTPESSTCTPCPPRR